MRRKSTKILVMSLVLSTLGIPTTQLVANAGSSYINWWQPIGKKVVELEQVITPLESGGDQLYYWATHWLFEGRATTTPVVIDGTAIGVDGAYMGVQTAGSRWDTASQGPIANFSIWGATSASPGPNAVCRKFDWEGIGIQCRLDLNTVMTGNKMTVKRSEDGLSWTAQIEQTNELPKIIATISTEAKFSITGVNNFQEYYGQNHRTLCGELPGAAAKFRFPKYVFEDGTTTQETVASFSKLPCISVDQKQFNPGLEVFMRQGKSQTPIPETKFELIEAAETKAKAVAEARAIAKAEAKAEAEVAAKASMTKKKSSLICLKGSTVLRVIGNNPKCSRGFKKNENLAGVNLKNANLSGVNLSGVNLSGVNLSFANLSNANLSYTNLTNANLNRATLSGANLILANLSGANLIFANLSGANLSFANLSNANLSYANLSNATLSGVNLSATYLTRVNLSDVNLSDVNLSRATLTGATLTGANLSSADLTDANLNGAILNNANLTSANLTRANLIQAVITGQTQNSSLSPNLSFANLSFANLSDVYLPFLNLSGANLSGAYLNNANLNRANLTRANLTSANLTSANLIFANLSGANLTSANLTRAILSGAYLNEAKMPDGTIHG